MYLYTVNAHQSCSYVVQYTGSISVYHVKSVFIVAVSGPAPTHIIDGATPFPPNESYYHQPIQQEHMSGGKLSTISSCIIKTLVFRSSSFH